ncbi:myelin-associated glycoprotein-like [Centropristis striata]|uniref:myelin-associated glycoprotein-like n=1 Tax=Centropristis striata TaxID=184440 RepID=UPI0027E03130|nr:myelin-associated glycoprotein-like [Centropristis striata]
MSVITVQSVKMVTTNMLLSVFFLSGALAACPDEAHLFITAPEQMEALSGSCLQIPCNFSVTSGGRLDSTGTTFGIWINNTTDFSNNPKAVIFNSSKMDIGDLNQKNCTTLFSSIFTNFTGKYFFRIENPSHRATASCNSSRITVKDSALRPWINISGDVNDLKEKQSVTITCSAFTPCPHSPPKLTWTLQQDPHNIMDQNTDGTFRTKIQETITLSDTHDGLTISCSAGYPVNEGKDVKTAAAEITLSVSYAPKDTSVSVSPSGLVSAGSWVNLTCSSRAKPPVSRFTWFKNSKDGAIIVAEGDFYSLNVTDGGDYYCVATNDLGNETSLVISLPIEGNSLPWGLVLGGIIGIIILICLASQTGGELIVKEPASKMEEEDIHYGEIDFSKRRPELPSSSEQNSGQQQETLYAQVNVSRTANGLAQTAEAPEDLYAEVKKY